VYTEVPKACIQAMALSEAVEPTQAAQAATAVGLKAISAIAGLSGLHLSRNPK